MENAERREPTSDKALPENSKVNLDRKLDHAIEETFPTSDPVSVSVTKGSAIDYDRSDREGQRLTEALLDRATETLREAAGTASDAVREAYNSGRRYAQAAGERLPQAERYYREGTNALRQYAAENPLLTLLVGVGIGYAVARLLHSRRSAEGETVPDYAKTRQVYADHGSAGGRSPLEGR